MDQQVDNLMQACVSLFESEFEKNRAYITGNKSIGFSSGKSFAAFYAMSECLRNLDYVKYTWMRGFLIDNFWQKTPKSVS